LEPQTQLDPTPLLTEGKNNFSTNSAPINVGVGVVALFILSVLLKFTPLGLWINRTVINREDIIYNYDEENDQTFLDNNPDIDNYLYQNDGINLSYNDA
ncbi:PIR Superfamily Protein, partial [Plasmodium ovale curtisi]